MVKYVVAMAAIAALAGQAVGQTQTQTQTPAAPAPLNIPASVKIAYINSQRLIEEAPGAREAQTTIERERNKYRAELELLEDSIRTQERDYQQRQVMLSPDAKKKQEDALRARVASFEQRTQTYDQTLQKRQQELIQPIMDRINKALEDIRKEHNIGIILDVASRSIVQADTTLDLTNEALRRLRAGSTAAAPRKQ